MLSRSIGIAFALTALDRHAHVDIPVVSNSLQNSRNH